MALGSHDEYTSSTATGRKQLVNCIHHRHVLLLLSPKADTHFTIPWSIWLNHPSVLEGQEGYQACKSSDRKN